MKRQYGIATLILAVGAILTSHAAAGQSKTGAATRVLNHTIMDANNVLMWVYSDGAMDHATWGTPAQNHLFDSGLWIGRNQQVMAWDQWFGEDWIEVAERSDVTDASGRTLELYYDDSAAPSSERIGLTVTQTTYQWTAPDRADFLVSDYRISNISGTELTNLYVGYYLDPDITVETSADDDIVSYDSESKTLYARDFLATVPGHLGIAILDSPGGTDPFTATSWKLGPDDPSSDQDEFALMTSGVVIGAGGTAGDQRALITAAPFDLGVAQTNHVVFGIALANSLTNLRTATATMREAYLGTMVASEPVGSELPEAIRLSQNYPNPFNPATTISYSLAATTEATLTVSDVLGRQVRVLASGIHSPGTYEVSFDAAGLSSGVYTYRLEAGDQVQTNRMVIVK